MRLHHRGSTALDEVGELLLVPPDGGTVVRRVERVRGRPDGLSVLKLAGVDDRDAAERLRGCRILVPRDALAPGGGDECYVDDLIGLEVRVSGGDRVGRVRDVYSNGAQEVLIVETGDGDVEVPFVAAFVDRCDPAAGVIEVIDFDLLRAVAD